jgi:hypothetical protein
MRAGVQSKRTMARLALAIDERSIGLPDQLY